MTHDVTVFTFASAFLNLITRALLRSLILISDQGVFVVVVVVVVVIELQLIFSSLLFQIQL